MTRVQVYLDPKHLDILDLLAVQARTSRSQALRTAVETAGKKVIKKTKKIDPKYKPLLDMAGFAKNAPANLSQNIDEIYLRD